MARSSGLPSGFPADPYWIVLGDIHDQIGRLAEIPELPGARGILVTGDLTLTGGVDQANIVMEKLLRAAPAVLAQIGNMDRPEVTEWLHAQGRNLHAEMHALAPDVAVFGVGASIFTPFGTPSEYPEAWFAEKLEVLWRDARTFRHAILVSHNPPLNTNCDRIESGQHVGSAAVREFIEEAQPAVCLCGHIHESRGEDSLGRTRVFNPGAFLSGCYALLGLNPDADNEPAVSLRRLAG
jgi:Icc-related predicted phosphoesterase